ncbi:hypothetical protein KEM54_003110 [Ascosphaera aggregata]|nr:hypothetical protein KEM54_003110 [Ascosphaera aggregata]
MGQGQSKSAAGGGVGGGGNTAKDSSSGSSSNNPASSSASPLADSLQSYPSFSKSDTQNSSRSIRDSLRMKMPSRKSISGLDTNHTINATTASGSSSSSNNLDNQIFGTSAGSPSHTPRSSAAALAASPRNENSTPLLGAGAAAAAEIATNDSGITQSSPGNPLGGSYDKSDVGSVKSATSAKSAHSRRHSSTTSTTTNNDITSITGSENTSLTNLSTNTGNATASENDSTAANSTSTAPATASSTTTTTTTSSSSAAATAAAPPPPPPSMTTTTSSTSTKKSHSYIPNISDPPPSPSHSSTLGRGHSDVESKQTTGEVEHVSNQPPSVPPISAIKSKPGDSILIRRENQINPIAFDPPSTLSGGDAATTGASSPGMGIGALRSIDLDEMISRLLDAGYSTKVTKAVCLKNAEIVAICTAARELLLSQPALVELSAPVKVVGDVHGQYRDLIRLFEMCGFPPSSNYLFLGDYVDRGKQSLETILLLMSYKLKYPENFFLLRGNHECANVTRVYGFYDECKRRCNIKIWKTFVDTFNCLPIAATVAGKIFCVHGGLSPSLSHMDDIRGISRPTDVPDYGLLNDLLWSDPADTEEDWEPNERGVSYCFGKKVILEFLQRHDFDLVCS